MDGARNHAAALPLTIGANRLVVYLPFRVPTGQGAAVAGPSGLEAVAAQLTAHGPGRLAALAGEDEVAGAGQASLPLWRQLDDRRARARLSGDLYPIAGHILNGDPASPASGCPGFVLDADSWIRDRPLILPPASQGKGSILAIAIEDAWVRLFGSGIGFLGVSVTLSAAGDEAQPLPADQFLAALHTLSQPPKRGTARLEFNNRFHRQRIGTALAVDSLAMADGPRGHLRSVQPAEVTKVLQGRGDGEIELYRCLQCSAADTPTGDDPVAAYSVLLERLHPRLVTLSPGTTGSVAKNGQLVLAPDRIPPEPGGVVPVLAAGGGTRADYAALETLKADRVGLARELPRHCDFFEWLEALLPESLRDPLPEADSDPVDAGQHRASRLFTYAAVRLDGLPDSPESIAACRQLAYRLARRLDEKYSPATDEIAGKVFAPFDTVFHSVATQGGAVVVRHDGSDFLGHFLGTVFATAYRPIAEICYHEYLYLLQMVQESALLPADPPDPGEIASLRGLTLSLARFRLFYRFARISHMSQHNQVLAIWRAELGLDVIESDLARDVQEAERLLADDVERADRQRRAERDARWSRYGAVGVFAATYLFCSNVIDDVYKVGCPSDRVALELTQVETRIRPLGDKLDLALEARGLGREPFGKAFDHLCTVGLPTETVIVHGTPVLPATFTEGPWRSQFDRACSTLREVRQCTVTAPRRYRLGAILISLALSLLLGGFAYCFRRR